MTMQLRHSYLITASLAAVFLVLLTNEIFFFGRQSVFHFFLFSM